jgi:phosphatidylglycerophosphate synthase
VTEGERWARAVLLDLRAAGFAPRAWWRFIARSFERAGERRRELRGLWVETIALAAAGVAVWGVVAASGHERLAVAGGIWWLAVCAMLDWHLGMVERPDGRRLHHLGAANVLSLARLGLVPALVALSPTALLVAIVGAQATDVLDGWIARRRDEVTRLGRWLDSSVDAVLRPVAAVAAARLDVIPAWAAALVFARYVAPALVVAVAYFRHAGPPPRELFVPARLPGYLLLSGLVLALLGWSGGVAVLAAGALGGTVTFAAAVRRLARTGPAPGSEPAGT